MRNYTNSLLRLQPFTKPDYMVCYKLVIDAWPHPGIARHKTATHHISKFSSTIALTLIVKPSSMQALVTINIMTTLIICYLGC